MASASRFGVSISLPNALVSVKPRSSATTSRMLGRSVLAAFGGWSPPGVVQAPNKSKLRRMAAGT
jgi:hypothetical protein